MIVANVVPRPPRTEMVKQKRPKKAQNPLYRRSTQTGFDTFWKRRLRRTALCDLRPACMPAWAWAMKTRTVQTGSGTRARFHFHRVI